MRFANVKFGYEGAKKNPLGIPLPELGVSEFLRLPNFGAVNKRINESKEKKEEVLEKEREKLPDSFDQDKYFKQTRNMLIADSLLRDFESRMQARRDVNVMKQTLPLVDLYAQTAADRRLMEVRSSPTKISQQRLRAQTGEAALMQAIANQTAAAAQAGTIGTSRRYGR